MSEAVDPVFLYLIHDSSLAPEAALELAQNHGLQAVPWADRETVPSNARVLLCLGDEQVRDLALLALERGWEIGVLPHDDAHEASTAMVLPESSSTFITHMRFSMKSPGPFYQYADGSFYQHNTAFDEQAYVDALAGVRIYEASGGVDFAALSERCLDDLIE